MNQKSNEVSPVKILDPTMQVYNQLLTGRKSQGGVDDMNSMNDTMRSLKSSQTNLGKFNSIWEKERDERMQKHVKLLNYKNRLEVQKMHKKFE